MTMITPSYLGETIEYSSLHACRSTLEDPTSGLDPVIASVVDELIMEMRDKLGVTSIVVSHNITSIFRISDKVAMLHEGQVLVQGTAAEVKASTNPIAQQFIQGLSRGPIDVAHR